MPLLKNLKLNVPIPVAVAILGCAIVGVGYAESKGLDRLEPRPPKRTSCVGCHTDRATLEKIATKANDPLFLVHHGDLTLAQLRELMSDRNHRKAPASDPGKGAHPAY